VRLDANDCFRLDALALLAGKREQETGSRKGHPKSVCVEHCGQRAHDQFGGARNAPSGMHQTYIHRPQDNKVTTYLISITTDCNTISDTSVSTNRHLRACRKTTPLLREEDLRPGRRPTTAHHRGRPAYLGLSWPPRDLALSWHLVGTQLRPHVIQIAVSLPR
jgi:hypothetical protein